MIEKLGIMKKDLLATELTLLAANTKLLTVIGALPVTITVPIADGTSVSTRDLLYII